MKLGAYKISGVPVSDMITVETSDLGGNPAFVIADTLPAGYQDISGIESMDRYAEGLIGSAYGFRDWKCLQRELKTLIMAKASDDLNANWDNLNANEKLIACRYILTAVPLAKFAATVPDEQERLDIATQFDFNNRQARGSWTNSTGRIQAMRIYLFTKLGTQNALEVFYDAVRDGLIELYEGGIEGTEEDGNIGINDFLLSTAGYSEDGLTTRGYAIIDGSGDSLADVANAMVDIASNGMY